MVRPQPAAPATTRGQLLRLLLAWAASAVALWWWTVAAPMHAGTLSDFLAVRACGDSGPCPTPVGSTALWIDLLRLFRMSGLPPFILPDILIGASALSVGMIVVAVRRHSGEAAAWLVGLGALAALVIDPYTAHVWSASAIPIVVTSAGVLLWEAAVQPAGRRWRAALAGLAVILCVALYPSEGPRTFGGLVGPSALALGWLAGRGRRFLAAVAVVVAAVTTAAAGNLGRPALDGVWTFRQTALVAQRLQRLEIGYGEARSRITGPACHHLAANLGAFLDDKRGNASEADSLLVTRLPMRDVPPNSVGTWSRVEFSHHEAAVVAQRHTWMRRGVVRMCTAAAGEDFSCRIVDTRERPEYVDANHWRHNPSLADPEGVERLRIELMLEVPSFENSRQREVVLPADDTACAWRIVEVEGVKSAGVLPATRVTIVPDGPPRRGWIQFERSLVDCRPPDAMFPPCPLELTPMDRWLLYAAP